MRLWITYGKSVPVHTPFLMDMNSLREKGLTGLYVLWITSTRDGKMWFLFILFIDINSLRENVAHTFDVFYGYKFPTGKWVWSVFELYGYIIINSYVVTSNYLFHNKIAIFAINPQVLNILTHEVETRLRFKVNDYYVSVKISPNQVMIFFIYGKLENN